MSGPSASLTGGAVLRQVGFVTKSAGHGLVLRHFSDPEESFAVILPEGRNDLPAASLLVCIAAQEERQAALDWMLERHEMSGTQATLIRCRNGQVLWRPGRAVLACAPEQADELLGTIAEFAWYEQHLRRLEADIAAGWQGLDEDKTLAFDVNGSDLRRSQAVGGRMAVTLQRRIALARLEPHLYAADAGQAEAARKLGEELRSQAGLEDRAEVLDSQLQVFEHIYEMSSQRMGEYRASRQAHIVEWVIILLLAAETLVMLWQALSRAHS